MKVKIDKLDNFGRGITYIDGKICFIDDVLVGDVVKVKVVSRAKKYLIGEVVDYYELSEDRVEVKCPYNDVCGGCSLSHMSYDAENRFKLNKVKEILKKFGGINEDKVKGIVFGDEWNYRNKVVLHGDDNLLGFYSKRSNSVVQIDECLLASSKINEVISILKNMSYNEKINEALIRVSNDGKEIMVSLKGDINNYEELRNEVDVLETNGEVILGDGEIISNIGDKKYYVSSGSFFQVNNKLTKDLYDEVLKVVMECKPKVLLDLYCGTGTIGIYVSEKLKRLIGVDYSKSGILDAKKNAVLNGLSNADFICDKVENVIEQFKDIDMVIVDPPRSGLDTKTIENIIRIDAGDVVYVSCDPVTLARDLKLLSEKYEVISVKAFNMFPKSYHVESVAILKRK